MGFDLQSFSRLLLGLDLVDLNVSIPPGPPLFNTTDRKYVDLHFLGCLISE